VNAPLLFAPAAHGGALFPGVMPLFVAGMAAPILKEAFTSYKKGELTLIVFAAIGIAWASGGCGHRAEPWPCAFSLCRIGLGGIHGRHATRRGRWPACRCHLQLSIMICVGAYLVSGGPLPAKAGLALHCNTASPTVTPCEEACRRRGLDRQRTSARATLSAHQLGGRLGHVR
jgi:hypothetical protein